MDNKEKKIATRKKKKEKSYKGLSVLLKRLPKVQHKGLVFIGLAFMFLGTLWALSPVYYRYQGTRTNKEMIENLEQLTSVEQTDNELENGVEEENTGKVIYDDNASREDVLKSASSIIQIPKIDSKLAIAEGVSNAVMKYAIGHFPDCGTPGRGNFCLSGHRQYTYNSFFNRLEEVEKEDLIIITSKGRKFTYRVYDTFTVEPTHLEVLDQTKEPTITLVTCTPIRVATHRFIVKGKLEKIERL